MVVYSAKRLNGEDKDQLIVQTPFGKGLVVKTRKGVDEYSKEEIKEIRLLDLEQSIGSVGNMKNGRNKRPMLYTSQDYDSVTPRKGDDVITPYGRGVIEETVVVKIIKKNRASNNDDGIEKEDRILMKYRVLLTSWRLAGRSRVKCFLFPSQVKVVRCKQLHEMDTLERIDYATAQKTLASKLFGQKKYNDALILYAQAVDAVRYVQHAQNTQNEARADLLVVIVTCSNNAATCCIQLLKFEEAARFAKNALILINALYNKRGLKIHGVILKDKQLSDAKMFGEWRAKSCLIIARSESKNNLISEALHSLRNAKEYILEFTNQDSNIPNPQQKRLKDLLKEVLKLKGSVIERKRIIREKEKARAQAMFVADSSSRNLKKIEKSKLQSTEHREEICTQNETKDSTSDIIMEKILENSSGVEVHRTSTSTAVKKQVTFAENLEEHVIMDPNGKDKEEWKEEQEEQENEGDEWEKPWYEEHKEALILLTLGGLLCLRALRFKKL